MLRRLMRSTLLGAAIVTAASVPSTASAQLQYNFTSCATAGLCGSVEAFFNGTLLQVRLTNADNILGSALFSAQLIFAGALNAATPGAAFPVAATSTPHGPVTSIGTTSLGGWSFGAVGGSNVLELASFLNVYIEGTAPSPFRALPGDPDSGTWVTEKNGYVEFSADLIGVTGVDGAQLVGLGFCTATASDISCVATPEPATLTLFATGLIGLAIVRRRRKSV